MTSPARRLTDNPHSALMETNALLRMVIDENPNIILMKDWDGKFLLGNRALAGLYGTTPEGLVGKDDGAFNPNAAQVAFYLQNVREVMTGGKTQVVMEASTDAATGETMHYQSIKIPLTTHDGKKQILVIANDVSELKRTQQKLEESERRLSYVLDATGEGIWDWDIAAGIVTHNRRWCQIAGLADDYLQHPLSAFAALLHDEDRPRVMDELQACLAGKGRYQSEHRMCLQNDRVVWVQDRGDVVERDSGGNPLRMVGSFVDITARKAAEALVREHGAQLEAIFALSPDGFVAFDAARLVKYVNPAFTRMTGLTAAEVQGLDESALSRRLAVLCAPGMGFDGLAAMRAMAPSHGDEVQRQVIELATNPSLVSTDQRVLSLALRESQAQGGPQILHLRDITHETEVDRLKSEFLSTAAHELRTPMASIYGFAEVLLTQKVNAAERKEFLGIIFKQSELMADILNELLDLARIEALRGNDFVLEVKPAQSLVADLVSGFKWPAGRTAPVVSAPDASLFIEVDRKKALQAVLNVLSNAYKYSSLLGQVSIAIEQLGSTVAIRITDQGIGMTPEQAQRVGERFYRADASGKVPGTGLGMSIVTEIMTLHHGRVEIESVPGLGTTVTLLFPVASSKHEASCA